MEHDFDIAKGFNEITVMFCRKCALSFMLVQEQQGYRAAYWEVVEFRTPDQTVIDSPGSCPSVYRAKGEQ